MMKGINGKKYILKTVWLVLLLCMVLGLSAQAAWKTNGRGTRYYANKADGYVTGWHRIQKKWYYFDENGYLLKGWQTIDGKRYYLNKKTGERVSGKWFRIGKNYYYAAKNGTVKRNKWIGNCYVQSNYRRASGWLTIGKTTYYMNPSTGKKTTGLLTLKKKKYYFNGKGKMLVNKWKTIKGKRYYFGANGVMTVNSTVTIDGEIYRFDANGAGVLCAAGQDIVEYALQFKGNPYVYGGTSLTNGADCSGFTYSVMKHFGINIPRTADDQRKGKDAYGTYTASVAVKPNQTDLKPGDLVFYGVKKPKYADHVALYIGNGKVIHAADAMFGIIVSNYDYRAPIAARRYV